MPSYQRACGANTYVKVEDGFSIPATTPLGAAYPNKTLGGEVSMKDVIQEVLLRKGGAMSIHSFDPHFLSHLPEHCSRTGNSQ